MNPQKTYLWQFGKLSLVLTLALSLWLALTTLPAYAQGPCFVETNGDNTTDFQSADASAVQAAVDAASAGDTLKIAGTCAGVQGTSGLTQTVYISKSLTLQGGYNQDNWAASQQSGVYTTTLDAKRGGRVAVVIGDIEVTLDGLVMTGGGGTLTTALPVSNHGAGIWTNSALTLTHSSIISNLITAGNGNNGAGIYNLNGTLHIADSLIADNENRDDDGGGMHISGSTVTIVRSTLQNNRTLDTSNNGGAIFVTNGSTLQISDSQLLDNYTSGTSANGGAISASGGNTVTITNSRLSGNTSSGASANGGAISVSGGTFFIENSLIQDNHTYGASATGGAVSHSDGVTIINSTAILSNTTTNAIGGGLYIGGGHLNINNSAIAYNRSLNPTRPGGGLAFNQFGNNQKLATLENVTLSGNRSAGEGGAIWVPRGSLTMTHVTLSDNSAITGTGGISVGVNGTVNMANSIIANSAHEDCLSAGNFNDLGYNLVEDGNCLSAGTSFSGAPLLGPLDDNGGSTQTHALLAGSPAIDASPGGSCALSADQRGISRPQGNGCDSGAFEVQTSTAGPLCYVHASASGGNDGTAWADAYTDPQYALLNINCTEIWVAAGTYYPTGGGDRTATFQLKNGVAIYGGFAGTETARDQRDSDPATNNTVLSGDISLTNNSSDNSYHVVTGSGTDSSAVLDGFTVTAGKANGSAPANHGAGMYNNGGSPALTNLLFSSNSASANGGGMYNASSSPTLTGVNFSSNSAALFGGGIYNTSSSPALTDIIFSDNSAGIQGGGMFNTNSSPTLTNVIFSGNSSNDGGGILNASSSPTLIDVAFSDNSANYGGGIYNYSSNPALTEVTFSGNQAITGYGGGIYNEASSPTLTNTTFSDNSAALGGGMFNYNSNPELTNMTFSGNSASTSGGGIFNNNSSPTLINVIIANSSGGDCVNSTSSLNAASVNNLIEEAASACGLTDGVDGNIIGSDPNLGPLADNGGSTQTHALLAGSPAIDAGDGTSCPATDQRGMTRPQGSGCDIGAFETQVIYNTLSVNVVGSGTVTPPAAATPAAH